MFKLEGFQRLSTKRLDPENLLAILARLACLRASCAHLLSSARQSDTCNLRGAEWVLDGSGKGVAIGGSADQPQDEKQRLRMPVAAYIGFRVVK